MPLFKRLKAHVLSAGWLYGDETTVPVLAKGNTVTGRIWVYVRDDKPFGGQARQGCVLLLARPGRRASSGAAGELQWNLPGRCLWRLWQALRAWPERLDRFWKRLVGYMPGGGSS